MRNISANEKPVRTRIDELEAPLPGLVFAGVGTQYHLWAVAEDSFDARAYTYYPPLPNVHDGGTVCWGDNRPPQASGQSILDAWRLFLGSPFSDHLAGQRSRAFPNDVRALLWRFHTEREPHFPTEDLVACPGKPTVGHQVERMIGGDR